MSPSLPRALVLSTLIAACGSDTDHGTNVGAPELPDECEHRNGINVCVPIVFDALAQATGGHVARMEHGGDLPALILDAVERAAQGAGGAFDLLIVIDGTGSMMNELDDLKQGLELVLSRVTARGGGDARVGIFQYRDKCVDDPWYLFHDLTNEFDTLRAFIGDLSVTGGGDIPESVYEGLLEAVTLATWKHSTRIVLVVGDSDPHIEDACSEVTFKEVVEAALEEGVDVRFDAIVVPLFPTPGG